MELSFMREALLVLLLFSLFVAWKVRKNGDEKLGCVGFGYVALVVFMIGMFSVLITSVLTLSTIENVTTYMEGEKCVASVISYSSYDSEDDEGNTRKMHTPTYRVQTSSGKSYEVEANFSSGGVPIVGDQVSVYFNENNQHFVELSATSVIMFFGMLIMWMVLASAFAGIILYAYNCDMSNYFKLLQAVGMYFFLPFVMICFEALLIYAFFYGNTIPTFVSVILLFFILVLGLAIWGMIKQLMKKGLPKWKKTGAGSWSADWEDDEQKVVEKPKAKKKKMVPLNEKYLEKKDDSKK